MKPLKKTTEIQRLYERSRRPNALSEHGVIDDFGGSANLIAEEPHPFQRIDHHFQGVPHQFQRVPHQLQKVPHQFQKVPHQLQKVLHQFPGVTPPVSGGTPPVSRGTPPVPGGTPPVSGCTPFVLWAPQGHPKWKEFNPAQNPDGFREARWNV